MAWLKSNLLVLVAAVVGVVLIIGVGWLLATIGRSPTGSVTDSAVGSEITLPIVILASVLALLIVLGLLTLLLSLLGLGSPTEALGLPGGSIRAVIALMLFVVFAIIAIYLFSIVMKHDVAAGIDLAKQLIVLIGTLVTAVASFYFGSNSSTAATKAALAQTQTVTGGPNAEKVDPPKLAKGGAAQKLKVIGTHLGNVKAVKLASAGQPPIIADAVTANDTEVTCDVTVPHDAVSGQWEVEVSDSANNFSRVVPGVTI